MEERRSSVVKGFLLMIHQAAGGETAAGDVGAGSSGDTEEVLSGSNSATVGGEGNGEVWWEVMSCHLLW